MAQHVRHSVLIPYAVPLRKCASAHVRRLSPTLCRVYMAWSYPRFTPDRSICTPNFPRFWAHKRPSLLGLGTSRGQVHPHRQPEIYLNSQNTIIASSALDLYTKLASIPRGYFDPSYYEYHGRRHEHMVQSGCEDRPKGDFQWSTPLPVDHYGMGRLFLWI